MYFHANVLCHTIILCVFYFRPRPSKARQQHVIPARLNREQIKKHCDICKICVFDNKEDYEDLTFAALDCPWLQTDDTDDMGWPPIHSHKAAGFNVWREFVKRIVLSCCFIQKEMKRRFETTFDEYGEAMKHEIWNRAPSLAICLTHILRKRNRNEQETAEPAESKDGTEYAGDVEMPDEEVNEDARAEDDADNDHDNEAEDDEEEDVQQSATPSSNPTEQPARKKRRIGDRNVTLSC